MKESPDWASQRRGAEIVIIMDVVLLGVVNCVVAVILACAVWQEML